MEVLQVAISILIGSMLMPWIIKIIGYFQNYIPTFMINILLLAIALKMILFVIHRGDEG